MCFIALNSSLLFYKLDMRTYLQQRKNINTVTATLCLTCIKKLWLLDNICSEDEVTGCRTLHLVLNYF